MSQLATEERSEGTRMHSPLENSKTAGKSNVDHLRTAMAYMVNNRNSISCNHLQQLAGSQECSPRLDIFSDYFPNSFCIVKLETTTEWRRGQQTRGIWHSLDFIQAHANSWFSTISLPEMGLSLYTLYTSTKHVSHLMQKETRDSSILY